MQINKRKENHKERKEYKCILVLTLVFFFLFSLSLPHKSYSQYYTSGIDNGNIKWRQIKTKKFGVIYPDFYEAKAQEFASALDSIYGFVGKTLNTIPPNVPFVLHTNTSYSNGLSTWAPKRNEIWTTTHPDTYAYPWMWQLAIHEWRHSVQVYSLYKGASKVLVNILGEHVYGLILGLYIPTWFMEGDAVATETALTPTGRGKTPDFNMYFKAQVMDKGTYSFDKALLGSKKDYVPNTYVFGYNLTAFGRQKYDKYIWADMLDNVGRNFWKFQFFGKSEKRNLKIDLESLYFEMIDSLKTQWTEEDKVYYDRNKDITSNPLGKKNKFYTNYLSPQKINDSTIISLKTSTFEAPQLIKLTNNNETKLSNIGRVLNSYMDVNKNKLLWSEFKYHSRWEHENYADIIEYDIETDNYKRITKKERLYTPSYNPNNENIIAAIEEDSINDQRLVILDKTSGDILMRFESSGSYDKFSYPSWSDKADEIFLIKFNQDGKSIGSYNIYNKTYTQITPFSFNNILKTKFHNGRLYFIGDYNNTYQVYSFNPYENSDYITQNTESRFGVKDFSFVGDSLIISQYTADGSKIYILPIIEGDSIKNDKETPMFPLAKLITEQEDYLFTIDKIKDTVYPSRKYSKIKHLFNFHSWAPIYINAESQDIDFGLSLFSQNILGTSLFSTGYRYLVDEQRGELFVDYTYKGWYPIVNLKLNYSRRNISLEEGNNSSYYVWNEYNSSLNAVLPYSWGTNNFNKYFNTILRYSFKNIIPINDYHSDLTSFHTFGVGFRTGITRSMAVNDLSPRLGQAFGLNLQRSLSSENASIFTLSSTTYLPSIFINHSFEIHLDYQKNTPSVYYFPNEVFLTRGVYGEFPACFYGAKFNYHLPLAYPDFAMGKLLYIQRLTGRGFFDFGYFDDEYLSSFGAYLQMDFNVFRIEYPVNIGVQVGYVPQKDSYFANLVFYLNM
ncbi:MAG: hypothetical protein WC135_03375 [Bacteroidales bacterium]